MFQNNKTTKARLQVLCSTLNHFWKMQDKAGKAKKKEKEKGYGAGAFRRREGGISRPNEVSISKPRLSSVQRLLPAPGGGREAQREARQ